MAKRAIYGNDTVHSSSEYSSVSPATKNVGGITAGTVLTGQTLESLVQQILAPYIEPTFSSFNVNITSPLEVGAALSGTKTFTWNIATSGNLVPNTIGICEVGGSLLASGLSNDGSEALGIGTKTNTSPTTWTWQITGNSTQDTSFSRNVSKNSIYPYFWGVVTCATRPNVDNTLVNAGNKVVNSSTGTVTVNFNSTSQWTWLAIPSTSPSRNCWYVNNLDNGNINNQPTDKYPDECVISITESNGCWSGVNYKIYMSGYAATDSAAMQFRTS